MLTYYPLAPNFKVKNPKVVGHDFSKLVKLYQLKPVYFMELGYPSGKKCNSSESKQAEFIKQVFRAWDKHPQRIRMISFTWLNDMSPTAVRRLTTYYKIKEPAFYEFLATLGLRTHPGSGKNKQAFNTLRVEAKKRGW